jgi:peptidoglycan/LPS O-acetylase OafA/YrhL
MRPNDALPAFRPDIEGLRGLAVLLVVLFHCGLPGVAGGFVGVDVFFVLSGFLITGLLVAEIQKTSDLDLLQFYARRVRRLLPAFVLTLISTLLIGALILTPHELDVAGHASRAAALYTSNLFFDINAGDYFAPDVKTNPLLHTWSLAVEEQFYLFWPLLVLTSIRWCRSMIGLVVVLSTVTILSLSIGVWFTARGSTFAFYELPARAWEFSLGGLAVLLPCRTPKMHYACWLALGWLGVFSILGSAHFLESNVGFPGWIALIPVMGTVACLIAGTAYPKSGIGVVLHSAPLQTLGRLSYSWYLWHWPFLVFAAALLPTISSPAKVATAVASLAVAAASYHFVENPVRFHPILLKRPALSVALAGVVTLCSLSVAFLTMSFAGQLAKEPKMKPITAAINDVTRLPRQDCVSGLQSVEVKICQFGNASSAVNIVLFGDSHAIQWFNPLERIASSKGWKLITVVKSSCPAFDIKPPGHSPGTLATCARWRADSLERIVELNPSIVFMGNLTSSLGQKDRSNPGKTVPLDGLEEGVRRTLEPLVGLRVVIMRDTPYFSYDIPTCLARSARHTWYPVALCEADESVVLNAAIFKSEQDGARGLSNVHFIDITDRICKKGTCKPIQGNALIYRDHHHLTGSFADSLMPILDRQLVAILNAHADFAGAHRIPIRGQL